MGVLAHRRAEFVGIVDVDFRRHLLVSVLAVERSPDCRRFRGGCPKKVRPGFGGSLAAREPVWDGEGWGCDRVACSIGFLFSVRAGSRVGGAAVAERDPHILV